MAYACPVCETIAPDGEHLAHHLAIVGMTRNEAHEAWLDEHAAGWREASPEELAATATEHAEQVDHELADEAAGGRPDVGHAHDHGGDHGRQPSDATSSTAAGGDETAAVLAEAREMTQRMLDEDGVPDDGEETAGHEDGKDNGGETGGDEVDGGGSDGTGNAATETDSDE